MYKIIFTCLGPNKKYNCDGVDYKDGDVAEVTDAVYEDTVVKSKYAQDHTEDLEIRTRKLIEVSERKRSQILEKMYKIQK